MNPRATILLAVLAVILGGITVYLLTYVPGGDVMGGAVHYLLDFKVSAVERITVKRKNAVAYDLAKEGDKWMFREPALGEANAQHVTLVLSDLRFEEVVKHDLSAAGEKVALDRYGLAPPKLEVVIRTSGKAIGFDVGGVNPTNDGAFVRLHMNDHVVLTGLKALAELDVPAERFKSNEPEPPK